MGSDRAQGVQDVSQVSGLYQWMGVGAIHTQGSTGGGLEAVSREYHGCVEKCGE